MFIDAHAHLVSDVLFFERKAILERARAAHIEAVINIITNQEELLRKDEFGSEGPKIFHVGATTPHDAEKEGELFFPIFEERIRKGEFVAIGETGLDYHYWSKTKKEQIALFRKYLSLSLDTKLPVVVHCREAFQDFLEIVDSDYQVGGKSFPGMLHCFTGTLKEAEGVLERGWMLSLSGIVTYKKSEELREVAKMVPLDQLLIETDSPFLAPQTKRGKNNEPCFLIETAKEIAKVKQISLEEVAEKTTQNAKRFFKLKL